MWGSCMEQIPRCKQCGVNLYDDVRLHYDRRKKYCDNCAVERKYMQDANRMREFRKSKSKFKRDVISLQKQEIALLKQEVDDLFQIKTDLEKYIIKLREELQL